MLPLRLRVVALADTRSGNKAPPKRSSHHIVPTGQAGNLPTRS